VLWLVSRNSLGREFDSLGPSTENARRPHEFRLHDELMTSGGAYYRWRLCAISDTETLDTEIPFEIGNYFYSKTAEWLKLIVAGLGPA